MVIRSGEGFTAALPGLHELSRTPTLRQVNDDTTPQFEFKLDDIICIAD